MLCFNWMAMPHDSNATTHPPKSDVTSMNLDDTELTLRLPGESRSPQLLSGGNKSCSKRGFLETVDLKLGSSLSTTDTSRSRVSGTGKCPPTKAQVVGWPPVRSLRKKAFQQSTKLVKVAVDGAPYLRKVDLDTYSSYQELFRALEEIFACFTIHGNNVKERKLMGPTKGTEYVPTYEDKEDDWMLVGDVPWKMFIESCKRIRLMKSSEAIELATRTETNC